MSFILAKASSAEANGVNAFNWHSDPNLPKSETLSWTWGSIVAIASPSPPSTSNKLYPEAASNSTYVILPYYVKFIFEVKKESTWSEKKGIG